MASIGSSQDRSSGLPPCAAEYIALVVRKMRYRKKVRRDIEAELTAHFDDELQSCTTAEERDTRARQVIEGFGDPKLLAVLCRRAKRRCRPLWKKAVVRSLQVCGIFLVYLAICTAPLFLGRPTIKMDYVQWLNDTGRANHEEADNAWPYYEKAAELYVETPDVLKMAPYWLADMNDAESKALRPWLAQNAAAIDMLRQGSQRPHCWNTYQADVNDLHWSARLLPGVMPEAILAGIYSNASPHLSEHRQLAFLLRRQALLEVYEGHVDAALRDCLVLARFGDHVLGGALTVEQLTGMAIEATAGSVLLRLLEQATIPADTLANVQRQWQERFDRRGSAVSFDAEKGLWQDRIQRSFTDDGKGNGHALLGGYSNWITGRVVKDLHTVLTFRTPNRREIQTEVDACYADAEKLLTQPPWEWTRRQEDANETDRLMEDIRLSLQNPQGLRQTTSLLRIESSTFRGMAESSWQRRVRGAAVITILALKRYQAERGQYPDDLQQLVVAGYLRDVPRDPFGPGPLTYKKTGDNFLLYSWGADLTDDAGRQALDEFGGPSWRDRGDQVFWPVVRERK